MGSVSWLILLVSSVTWAAPSSLDSPGSPSTTSYGDDSASTTAITNCQGYTTYTNVQPVTVYVTVTEGYTLTVTQNGSMTASEIYVTPPSACAFTILTTSIPSMSVASASSTSAATSSSMPVPPYANTTASGFHSPLINPTTQLSNGAPNLASSSEGSNGPWGSVGSLSIPRFNNVPPSTTTITVTKKTPVGVPPSSSFDPVVQFPGAGSNSGGQGNTPPTTNNGASQHIQTPHQMPTSDSGSGDNNGAITIGGSTSYGAATPTTTLVNGVPVQVGPSSVYLGGSYVALPQASATSVVINGETYTVDPTAIIGPSTTLSLSRQQSVTPDDIEAIVVQSSTITRDGITATIGETAAAVLGTTYRIGAGAPSTTAVVQGETITFDSAGVAFPGTTYAPASSSLVPLYVTTTIGGLTFSLDQSEAILSSTTYQIGSGAKRTTVVVSGTTVVFGPSGIVLPSTTISPTTPTGDSVSSANAKATGTAALASSTGSSARSGVSRVSSSTSKTLFSCFIVLASIPVLLMML